MGHENHVRKRAGQPAHIPFHILFRCQMQRDLAQDRAFLYLSGGRRPYVGQEIINGRLITTFGQPPERTLTRNIAEKFGKLPHQII